MSRIPYSPLASQTEVRVIQLLTEEDNPRHATGLVHCKIRHVLLEDSQLAADGQGPKIGSDGTWTIPIAADIEIEPRISDSTDSNALWRRSLLDRIFPWIRTPILGIGHYSLSSRLKAKSGIATGLKSELDPEAGLPWRYTWGDYVALSYVWGDPSIQRGILIDDMPVLVTANLEAALRQLRSHSRIRQGFSIWIDALCINQADPEERKIQVARMNDIYARACHTVVWLGSEANNSDLAMMAMRFLSLRSREENPLLDIYQRVDRYVIRLPYFQWKHSHTTIRMSKDALRAIYHLLARPYWRRVWIIQEIALATRKSPVLCGDSCILLDDVYNALQVVKGDSAALGRYVMYFAKGVSTLKRAGDSTEKNTYALSEKLWERPNAILDAQCEQEGPATQTIYRGIFGALLLSRGANASDERDRVYGILGLPCLAGIVDILADYTLSPNQAFTDFSKSLLLSGNLNGLRLVNSAIPQIGTRYLQSKHFSRPRAPKLIHKHRTVHEGCIHTLPSWVICWSCSQNPSLPLPSRFCALPTGSSIPHTLFHDQLLIIRGVLFDTIATLSAFHATESDRNYPQNGPYRSSIYGSASATREAFWRTLITDTDSSDQPAPEEYSTVLHPQIWDVGINGPFGSHLRGLAAFYHRNKRLMIFNQSLSRLINGPKTSMAYRMRERVKPTGRLLRPTTVQRDATLRASRILAWRRLVTTHGGYIGLVPASARADDVIAVLGGCDVPLILRLREDTNQFYVVGECYVHGLMSGEVLEFVQEGRCEMVDITLC